MDKDKNGRLIAIASIAEQTKDLSWDDLSGFLEINEERAHVVTEHSLVGGLVSR